MNSKILNIIIALVFLILGVYGVFKNDYIMAGISIIGFIISIIPLLKKEEKNNDNLISKIEEVIKKAANGDFEGRITNIPKNSPFYNFV